MSLPVAPLALSDEDRSELGLLLASGDRRLLERARIVVGIVAVGVATAGFGDVVAGIGGALGLSF